MNNRAIKTYEDLEKEEQRLTARLAILKQDIKEDIGGVKEGVKEKLNPLKKIKTGLRNMFVREGENGPAINFALGTLTDVIVRFFIPRRTNVFTKTVIPFVTKNIISNLITEQQRNSIMGAVNTGIGKVDGFIRKKLHKKQQLQVKDSGMEIERSTTYHGPATNVDTNPMNL